MMQVGRLLLALHVITVTTVGFSACVTANPTVWTQRRSKDNTIRRQQTYPSLISAAAGTRGQQVAFGFRRSSTSSTEKVVASRTLEEAVKEEPEGLGAVNEPAPSRLSLKKVAKDLGEACQNFKRGTTSLVTNYKICRDIRSRVKAGHELTYGEYAHLQRGKQDRNKLIRAALIYQLSPEYGIMLLVYLPNTAPTTYEDPDKTIKYQRESLKRVKATLHSLTQLEDDALKSKARPDTAATVRQARSILETKSKRELFERFQDQVIRPVPETEQEAKKARNKVVADMPAPLAKVLGDGMRMGFPFAPAWFIRPQLREYAKQLDEADSILMRQPLDTLSESDLLDACSARGMEVVGRSAKDLRNGLKEWLELTSEPLRGTGQGQGQEPGQQGLLGDGMVFVPERAKLLGLGANFLELVREGKQAELSRIALRAP